MKDINKAKVKACRMSSFILSDSVKKFDSGNKLIDDFFKNEALEFDEKNIAATTIYYDEITEDVVGFYTIAAGIVSIKTSKIDLKRIEIPTTRQTMEEFPSVNLNYFAVDKEYQNQRVGTAMMYHLFLDLVKSNYDHGIGFSCIFLEALNGAYDFYEQIGFEPIYPYQEKMYLSSYQMMMSVNKLIDLVRLDDGFN